MPLLTEAVCIFSAKLTDHRNTSLEIMSAKSYYTRFLFIFIIYIIINLLIKINSSDYTYGNLVNVLKNHNQVLHNTTQSSNNKYGDVSGLKSNKESYILPILKQPNFFIDLKENEKTIKQIAETCKENNLTTSITKRNFLYNLNHKGIYCWIRKAGSTSFTKLFSDMNNRGVLRNYYREIDFLSTKNEFLLRKLIQNKQIFKFLVVRHPFERLVSAYRDRIEDNSKYTAQSWIYAQKIFRVTRPELFDSPGAVSTSLTRIFYEDKRLRLIPTFKEFVKWLLQQDTAKDDPHWNQYYRHCALCSIQYDYVLKLDNYTKTDIDYVFYRLNLNKDIVYLSNLEQTKNGRTDFDETCNYFKNLTHEAVVSLYERYRIDFEMLNYEFDKYFECTDGD